MTCPKCSNLVSYLRPNGTTGTQINYLSVCAACDTQMSVSSNSPYSTTVIGAMETNIVYIPPYEGGFELFARVECNECGYYESEGTCNFSGGKITYKCPKCGEITELADLNPSFTTITYTAGAVNE